MSATHGMFQLPVNEAKRSQRTTKMFQRTGFAEAKQIQRPTQTFQRPSFGVGWWVGEVVGGVGGVGWWVGWGGAVGGFSFFMC